MKSGHLREQLLGTRTRILMAILDVARGQAKSGRSRRSSIADSSFLLNRVL
jgi:hypothetical protein